MSGGHFDYLDMRISDIIDILQRDNYNTKKMEKILKFIMNILHSYDWFISGDTSEGDFKKDYYKELQNLKRLLK